MMDEKENSLSRTLHKRENRLYARLHSYISNSIADSVGKQSTIRIYLCLLRAIIASLKYRISCQWATCNKNRIEI